MRITQEILLRRLNQIDRRILLVTKKLDLLSQNRDSICTQLENLSSRNALNCKSNNCELSEARPTGKCCFCRTTINDETSLGDKMRLKDFTFHLNCALLSGVKCGDASNSSQRFLYQIILWVVQKSRGEECGYCHTSGASIHCKACGKPYHLPCGLLNNHLCDLLNNTSYCAKHKPAGHKILNESTTCVRPIQTTLTTEESNQTNVTSARDSLEATESENTTKCELENFHYTQELSTDFEGSVCSETPSFRNEEINETFNAAQLTEIKEESVFDISNTFDKYLGHSDSWSESSHSNVNVARKDSLNAAQLSEMELEPVFDISQRQNSTPQPNVNSNHLKPLAIGATSKHVSSLVEDLLAEKRSKIFDSTDCVEKHHSDSSNNFGGSVSSETPSLRNYVGEEINETFKAAQSSEIKGEPVFDISPSELPPQNVPSNNDSNHLKTLSVDATSSHVSSLITDLLAEKRREIFDSNDCVEKHHSDSSSESSDSTMQVARKVSLKKYKCNYPDCSFAAKTPALLKIHQGIHSDERPYKCPHEGCNASYRFESALTHYHMRTHTGYKPFKCTFQNCTSAFITNTEYKRHQAVHTGKKQYKCYYEGCGLVFTSSSVDKLKEHHKTHTGRKPFHCQVDGCGASFRDPAYFRRHKRVHDRVRRKPTQCDFPGCSALLSGAFALKIHKQQKHMNNEPFKCVHDGCTAAFRTKTNFESHTRIHTGEKPFICTYGGCKKKFRSRVALDRHGKVHTGDKPYKCGFGDCKCAFSQKSSLKRHMLTHTGEKPYKCNYDGCNVAFAQSFPLTLHKRKHESGLLE